MTIQEAQARLSALIRQLVPGDEVVIVLDPGNRSWRIRWGTHTGALVRMSRRRRSARSRQTGSLRGGA